MPTLKCETCLLGELADIAHSPINISQNDTAKDVKSIQEQIQTNIITFYEKFSAKTNLNTVMLSLIYGFLLATIHFLFYHYAGDGKNIFDDFNWFLSIVSPLIFYLLFIATDNLKRYVIAVYSTFHLSKDDTQCYDFLKHSLNTSTMVQYGIFFGIINTTIGYIFGIEAKPTTLYALTLFEFFNVGCVCGLCFTGVPCIIRVAHLVKNSKKTNVNLLHSDNCAGSLIIGNFLFKFTFLVLFGGLLVSFYIYGAWTIQAENALDGWRKTLFYFWIFFPHLLAFLLFTITSLTYNLILKQMKSQQLANLNNAIHDLQLNFIKNSRNINIEKLHNSLLINALYTRIEYINNKLKKVNAWPYDLASGTPYILAYLLSFIAPFSKIASLIN